MGRRTGRRPRDPDPEAALAEHPERDERRAPGGDDAPLPGEAGRAGRDRGDEERDERGRRRGAQRRGGEHAVFKLEETPEQQLILYTALPTAGTPEKLARLMTDAGR